MDSNSQRRLDEIYSLSEKNVHKLESEDKSLIKG